MVAEELHGLLLAWTILAAGLFGPGPNNLAIANVATAQGRPEGVQLALGLVIGGMAWLLAGVFGLSALLATSAVGSTALRAAAALYLLWLAIRAFGFAVRPPVASVRTGATTLNRMIVRGMALSLTNPKSALMWMAVAALGVGPEATPPVVAALISGAAALALGGHLSYALAFSSAPVGAVYGRWQRWIQGIFGVFLCYASFRVMMVRG